MEENKVEEVVEVASAVNSQESDESLKARLDECTEALKAFKGLMSLFTDVLNRYDGGKRQLVRSWTNAALSPLNDSPLAFSYPEERELFNLYTELNGAKFILMVHGLQDAGVLTLHKPLMSAIPKTASEMELNKSLAEAEELANQIRKMDEGK